MPAHWGGGGGSWFLLSNTTRAHVYDIYPVGVFQNAVSVCVLGGGGVEGDPY